MLMGMLLRGSVLLCTVGCLTFACITLQTRTLDARSFAQANSGRSASTSAVEPAIAKLLAGIRAADKGQLAVSEEDGRFLRILVGATNAKSVLEIGAASGYSGIWIGLGLRQTGGHLTTIEYDPVRA